MTARSDQKTKERRLAAAGLVSVRSIGGYVSKAFADRIRAQVQAFAGDVERIAAVPSKGRGRPRKTPATG